MNSLTGLLLETQKENTVLCLLDKHISRVHLGNVMCITNCFHDTLFTQLGSPQNLSTSPKPQSEIFINNNNKKHIYICTYMYISLSNLSKEI